MLTAVNEIHAAIVALGPREFAGRAGFKVDRRGRGACPIHGGHNGEQFALTAKRGEVVLAHCFNCGFAGDAIDLLGALRGRTDFAGKLEAVAELLAMAPIPANSEPFEPETERIDQSSYHNVVTELVAECRKYQPIRDVARYIKSRGVLDAAVEYGLFALPPVDCHRSVIDALLQQFELETLVAAGLGWQMKDGLIRRDALSFARNRLCIPWRSPEGRIETLQRRVLDSSNPRYVFPKGIKALHPFGIDKLKCAPKDQPIALVEGALDCLSLAVICSKNDFNIIPLALGSVSNWGDNWGQYCSGRVVYIALDNDTAGTKAFGELAVKTRDAGATQVRWWRPEAKDWNDELTKVAS